MTVSGYDSSTSDSIFDRDLADFAFSLRDILLLYVFLIFFICCLILNNIIIYYL